jgi:hypothetical protein
LTAPVDEETRHIRARIVPGLIEILTFTPDLPMVQRRNDQILVANDRRDHPRAIWSGNARPAVRQNVWTLLYMAMAGCQPALLRA